jgi:chemotaxis protein CheX
MTKDMFSIFLKAGHNTFSTMLRAPLSFGEPSQNPTEGVEYDISGIIGMTGDLVGSVVISMPWETAKNCMTAFTGVDNPPEEDVCDAIGELANMIAGSAKAQLEGKNVSISCPSVVRGKDLVASRPKSTPCVRIPCSSDLGDFELLLCVQPANVAAAAA